MILHRCLYHYYHHSTPERKADFSRYCYGSFREISLDRLLWRHAGSLNNITALVTVWTFHFGKGSVTAGLVIVGLVTTPNATERFSVPCLKDAPLALNKEFFGNKQSKCPGNTGDAVQIPINGPIVNKKINTGTLLLNDRRRKECCPVNIFNVDGYVSKQCTYCGYKKVDTYNTIRLHKDTTTLTSM